jgi:calcineurin-like phosphoesterase family protein
MRWHTADLHFNHPNIARYCNRPALKSWMLTATGQWASPDAAYECAEKMNAALIRATNARVGPTDTVVHYGDFSCRGGEHGVRGLHTPPAEIIKQLNGRWVLITGNHDKNNGVHTVCDFVVMKLSTYTVGGQHKPLFDYEAYAAYQLLTPEAKAANPWFVPEHVAARETLHAKYCLAQCHFIICGHVHNSWQTKKIAGIWHVNVGVDANNGHPLNDVEVLGLYHKALQSEKAPEKQSERQVQPIAE